MFEFRGLLGVPVEVSRSLIGFFLFIFLAIGLTGGDPAFALLICGTLLVSIYLHELGHAGAALAQGVHVRGIVLYGGGGLCYHSGGDPKQQLIITLGGPLVNLALWLGAGELASTVYAAGQVGGWDRIDNPLSSTAELAAMVHFFGQINMLLFIFNLLPVMPLDGGKVLFLVLWYKLSRRAASRVAGFIGLVISVLWIPATILLFLSAGIILFFFPSIRDNWEWFRGDRVM